MANLTLFGQIIKLIDRDQFNELVSNHNSDFGCKGFDSWTHVVSMLFCQFAKSTSIRDISLGLNSATGNFNHLDIKRAPSKSAIAYQNKKRSSKLFEDLYYKLNKRLGQLAKQERLNFKIKAPIYLLDSTTISLAMSLFDWAKFKTTKGALKMHTVLEYDGHLPAFVRITDGKTGDNKAVYDLELPEKSVVVADRFYNDFNLLRIWDSRKMFFVIRHKENLQYTVVSTKAKTDLKPNLLVDEIIEFAHPKAKKNYPKRLRRVVVWDEINEQKIELITNNFEWSTETIGALYRSRWQVEIFFREIKQLLHVKTFIGTSQNAVEIQLWSALITMLLLRFLKARAKFKWHLSNLVAFIRLNVFVKINLWNWLDSPVLPPRFKPPKFVQGVFNFG